MTSLLRLAIPLAITAAVGAGVFIFAREKPRPLTPAELQGEWVQDPDFLQNAGADLEAQKREVDGWENYEFTFMGQRLTGWRVVHDETTRDASGWTQGKGVHFESDYSIEQTGKAVKLLFTDHAKARQQAQLEWDGDRIAVTLNGRKFRIKKAPAENLRIRKLVVLP